MPQIEIRVKGHIDEDWSLWLAGFSIEHCVPDETLLSGTVPDQTAVFGIIARLRDLGLQLRSVVVLPPAS